MFWNSISAKLPSICYRGDIDSIDQSLENCVLSSMTAYLSMIIDVCQSIVCHWIINIHYMNHVYTFVKLSYPHNFIMLFDVKRPISRLNSWWIMLTGLYIRGWLMTDIKKCSINTDNIKMEIFLLPRLCSYKSNFA